jgi:hypothetical protein
VDAGSRVGICNVTTRLDMLVRLSVCVRGALVVLADGEAGAGVVEHDPFWQTPSRKHGEARDEKHHGRFDRVCVEMGIVEPRPCQVEFVKVPKERVDEEPFQDDDGWVCRGVGGDELRHVLLYRLLWPGGARAEE